MVAVIHYDAVREALANFRNHYLLLGNGFSIAVKPDIFTYASLFAHADLSKAPHLAEVFERLGTQDFEIVIRSLVDAAKVVEIYDAGSPLAKALSDDANLLKDVLVNAIASRHPDRPYDITPDQYAHARVFLSAFGKMFTLNYDVLLYWALMQDEVDDLNIRPDDGFRAPEDEPDAPWVSWQEAQSATVYYLHGALHLFDVGSDLVKYTWSRTDIPIVEQIRQSLAEDRYPLFVAEGSSDSKLTKIMHSAYLHKALRGFDGCMNTANAALVVYGHSLAANDGHVLRVIAKGRVPQIFVSLYGDPGSPGNLEIVQNANALIARRAARRPRDPVRVEYFDAASAKVWG